MLKKISVSVTPQMASRIKDIVKGGEYGSTSEVVREALRDWSEKRARKQAEIDYLRTAWDKGIKSGPGRFRSFQDIRKEARKRAGIKEP